MKHPQLDRFASWILAAGLVASGAALLPGTIARADGAENEKAQAPAADADKPSAEAEKAAAAEPERISGKITKVDAASKMIKLIVQQRRAYKSYKLYFDDKSLILVSGQPSNLEALSEGQVVDVGYFRKGKKDVIDTITVP